VRPLRALGAGALLWLTLSAPAPAEDIDPLASPFSREQLLLYFDRADRASTVEQWLQVMEVPLAALPEWERERVQEMCEARLSGWIRRSWRAGLAEPDLRGFLEVVEQANRRYLFVTEPSGAIGRDELGDPLLRPADQFDLDHAQWRGELGRRVDELVSQWEREAEISFHEILARLPPGVRDRAGAGVRVTLKEYCSEVRREFERLYRQAESRFLEARLRDRYSLRSKSESRTAGELAGALIRRTQGELDEGLDSLRRGPEEQHGESALVLDPGQWQEQFLAEFQRGIEAWSRAEQHLLEQRIRWESDARNAFVQAEAAWDCAFAELERARESWAAEMTRCLSEGRQAWDLAEEDFVRQFAETTAELAESSRAELTRLSGEVSVLLGVYRQCVDLIELAERNVDFLTREIRSVQEGSASAAGADGEGTTRLLLEELAYWQGESGEGGVLGKYRAAGDAARDALLDLEARIRAYGGNDLPADSLEREIARLEAEGAYLQRQVEIAEAVVRYAEDASPGRATEAETVRALASAQAELLESGRCCSEALQELQRLIEGELSAAALELAEAREALEDARDSLDRARRRYADAWSSWCAQDAAILEALVRQYDEALEGWYAGGRVEAYRSYFATWESFEGAELHGRAEELLRDLRGQGGVDRVPDLSLLQARSDALAALRLDWSEQEPWARIAECLDAAGMEPDAPELGDLQAAVQAALSGDALARARAEHQLALLAQSAGLEMFRNSRLAELLEREALPVEEAAAEIAAVRSAAEQAEGAYRAARQELGRQALQCLQGDSPPASPEAAALAELLRLAGAGSPGTPEAGGGLPADEALSEELFWVDGLDLRELFLEGERRGFGEAQAVLELYELFGRMFPFLASHYRSVDAAAWCAALGAGEGEARVGVLESLRSPQELVELCDTLARLPAAPPYLKDVVTRALALAAAGVGLAPGEVPAGSSPWLAAIGEIQIVDERLAEDLAAYTALFFEAVEAFRSPDWSRSATQAEARDAQLAVLSGERSIAGWLEGRRQAAAARDAWAEGFSGYQEAVLGPLQKELADCESLVASRQGDYDLALERFASVSVRYLELHSALEAALARQAEARLAVQEAEEIHAYAANGYPLVSSGPEAVLTARRQALARVSDALEVLRAMDPMGLQQPFAERMDSEYRRWKDQETALMEGLQQLVAARGSMEGSAVELRDALERAAEELSRAAFEVFSFSRVSDERESLEFAPDFTRLESGELTDFRSAGEAALAQAVADYFQGDRLEVSERFSTDVALWLLGMASYGGKCSALLWSFGVAYYYDAVVQGDLQVPDPPQVSIGILSAPSLRSLVGPTYLDLGERWVKVCVGSREDQECHWEYRYPEDKLTVEDYLARTAKSTYEGLQANGAASRLYAFYKAMLASGHLADGTRFIGKDLSDLAYRYVETKAAALQSSLGQWWKFLISPILGIAETVKAQAIQELRNDLATRRVTGAGERAALSADAADAARADADRRVAAAALELLCGGSEGEGIDSASFLQSLADQSGRPAVPAVQELVEQEFSRLNGAQVRNALCVLDALQGKLEERLGAARLEIQQTAAARLQERAGLYRVYQRLLYDHELDREALEAAARELYWNPAFTGEDFRDYELKIAVQTPGWSPRGEVLRLEALAGALVGLMQQRLELLQSAAHDRLLLQLRELGDRRNAWERTIGEILAAGAAAWREGAERMLESRLSWYRRFEEEYDEKRALWEAGALLLRSNRELWVQESARSCLLTGSQALARDMGLEADRLAAESELLFVPDMSAQAPDPARLLSDVLGGSALSSLVEQARALVARAEGAGMVVAAFLPQVCFTAAGQAHAREFAADVGEEIFRRAALVTALQMRRAIEQAEAAAVESIAGANADMDESLSDTMASGGYSRSGQAFQRLVVVDHTLLAGSEREAQSVPAFVYFAAPALELGVDLSREALEGRSGEYVRAVMAVAQENLQRYMKLIFGRSKKEREQWSWAGIGEELKGLFDSRMAAFRSSAGYDRKYREGTRKGQYIFHDTEGLFNLHIGYEPIMDEDDPERVKEAGFGELGRIMEPFFRNEVRLARGIALLTMPWYNQRLWDDDADNDGEADAFLAAPTVRSLTNIAVSIAATATGQVWLAAAINLADDLVFTVADVANQFLEADQAFLSFGKQALVTIATSGIGAGMDTLSGMTGAFGESVIGRTLFQGVESLSSGVVASAIGAVELSGDGFSFDTESFTREAFGRQALAAYAGGLGGTLVASSLGELNLRDSNDVRLSPTVFRVEQIEAFNSLTGGAVSAAVQYAIGGQTTLNLLNFRDVAKLAGWNWFRNPDMEGVRTGSWMSHGLLELTIGADDVALGIGQRGADVSLSALAAGAVGLSETLGVTGFKIGGIEGRSTLNAVNLLGYSGGADNWLLGRQVFTHSVSVQYEELGAGESRAGLRGYVDHDALSGFVIARTLLGGTLESSAQLAALFSHEGSHLLGNRIEALAYMREGQTYLDLMRTFGVGEAAYLARLSDEILSDGNWLSNVGSRDHAEWYRTSRLIGIRASTPADFLPFVPVIGGLFSGVATLTEANPYTNAKLPTSAIDDRRHALQAQMEADRLGALISVGSLVASAIQAGVGSGMTVPEIIGSLFDYNPANATSWNKALDVALSYTDIALTAMELFDRGDIRVDRPQGFERFKESVLSAERFKDIKGYWSFEDNAILKLAERAGVPLVAENQWAETPDLEAQAINELINNFNFVSALYQMGVRDATIVSDLYYRGIPYSVTDPDGTVWFFNSPGFAEANKGLTSRYEENLDYIRYHAILNRLRDFNIAGEYYRSLTIDLDSVDRFDTVYRSLVQDCLYIDYRTLLWNQYNYYELNLFGSRR